MRGQQILATIAVPVVAVELKLAPGVGGTTPGPWNKTSSTTSPPTDRSIPACAIVSSSWSAQKVADPEATPTVAASLAHACLNSVPLGKQAAIDLVDAIGPYLEWQSDAAYKANPPRDYSYPGYDMFTELANIKANLQANEYRSEWEWQHDLYIKVFGAGHDGHFVFYPDALTKVFEWRRARALVSISEDGKSLPVIKVYEDYLSSPETASVVKLINGIDAATYISDTISMAGWNQDADAAYNSMFYSLANLVVLGSRGYFQSGGRTRYVFQGFNTTFAFANGTVTTFENTAAVNSNLTGVVDGPSYYSKFCTPPASDPAGDKAVGSSSSSALSSLSPSNLEIPIKQLTTSAGGPIGPGYPKDPVISTQDGVVSGYYLPDDDEDDHPQDVAVIALTAFESSSIREFQAVVHDFFAEARAAGKRRLIIDVQGNGGGYILLGYDFFRQLFPHIVQDGFSRWKESDSFMAMSRIVSERVKGANPHTTPDAGLVTDWESWYNWRYDLSLGNEHFGSFDDKFAARVYEWTKYTSIMRWDLKDNLTTTNGTFGVGIEITGYGGLASGDGDDGYGDSDEVNHLEQLFRAEDVVILYDGTCASTCSLASEMLRIQGGVRSVAMGGRPQAGSIQGAGGVKGAQVLGFASIYSSARRYLRSGYTASEEDRRELKRFGDLPLLRSTGAAVNVRDQILRGNLEDGLPAQFVNTKADCRLYWRGDMLRDVRAVWRAVASVAWGGKACNAGAVGTVSSKAEKMSESGKGGSAGGAVGKERRSEAAKRLAQARSSPEQELDENWAAAFRQRAIP